MGDLLFAMSIPAAQLAGLLVLGWLFRVDKPTDNKP
jgi:hypothetical protein